MLKIVLCASLALAGLTAYAQDPPAAPGKNATQKAASAMTGTVKSYEAGKSIEVDVRGVAHKYDLSKADDTFTIGADVRVGSEVTVMETSDNTGHKSVSIEPFKAQKGAPTRKED